MDIILISGLWLTRSVWDDVAAQLESMGHRPLPVALPGADDGSTSASLEDQVSAVIEAVDSAKSPMVVGHSAACTLAWITADKRPDQVESVVLIGGFPGNDGTAYADFFATIDGMMPFPGWEPFAGPDSDDLDAATRETIASNAVSVPEGVSKGVISLSDERRFDVPVLLVCPEYSPDDARAWIEAGDVPELEAANHVEFVDIDSGHWPMFTRSSELARILHTFASR
jgi:pimeloyl-ACP methyl ester carboxylesterase